MTLGSDEASVTEWLMSFVSTSAARGEAARLASARLLERLGNPQDRTRAVHIVGTAGKGSVATLLTAGLVAGGNSVTTHLSPHVYDIRERFCVNGRFPDWDEVAEVASEVAAAAAGAAAGEPTLDPQPTFFALTAALAFELGRRASTDWAVVEAGIGGRVDATNVFGRDDVLTIITAIGSDHTDVLGETIEAIAVEKAAVLKGRTHAVLGPQPHRRAAAVVRAMAAQSGVDLVEVAATGDWRDDAKATARAARDLLRVRSGVVLEGSTNLQAPGRDERHTVNHRLFIFDGAHNRLKLAALARSLPENPIHAVVAIGATKNLLDCVSEIAAFADRVTVVEFGFAENLTGPRSWPAATVVAAFRRAGVCQVAGARGAAEVRTRIEDEDEVEVEPMTVVVTGSFLHLASLRRELVG